MEELTGWGGGDAEVGGDKMSVSNKQSFLCINIYIYADVKMNRGRFYLG